MMNVISSIN